MDYTTFNISVTFHSMYSLLHSYYSSYFCQDFFVVYSIPSFTFCRWLESTTNISDSLILLDLVVEFLVGSFQEKFPKLSLLLYKWVRHSFILKGTTRLPWIRAVEGAAPSLTFFLWPLWSMWHCGPLHFFQNLPFWLAWCYRKVRCDGMERQWTLESCKHGFEPWLHITVLRLDQIT